MSMSLDGGRVPVTFPARDRSLLYGKIQMARDEYRINGSP